MAGCSGSIRVATYSRTVLGHTSQHTMHFVERVTIDQLATLPRQPQPPPNLIVDLDRIVLKLPMAPTGPANRYFRGRVYRSAASKWFQLSFGSASWHF